MQSPAAQLAKKIEARIAQIKATKLQMQFAPAPVPPFEFDLDTNIDIEPYLEGFRNKHNFAVSRLAKDLDEYLDAAMKSGWSWTGGARDIVDTGALMASGGAIASGNKISVAYTSPYANLVHYGGYVAPYGNMAAEKVYIPARPWVSMAFGLADGPLPPFDFAGRYRAYMDM